MTVEQDKSITPEFACKVNIEKEWIDENGHVNHARHLTIYEEARKAYLETECQVRIEDFEKKYGLRPIVVGPFYGNFGQELLSNESITVFTAVESASRYLQFSQRIVKNGQAKNKFNCKVYFVDKDNVFRRVPDELRSKITQAKSNQKS